MRPKPVHTSTRLSRLFSLARYHRPSQFARRALSVVRRRLPLNRQFAVVELPPEETLRTSDGFQRLLSSRYSHGEAFDPNVATDTLQGIFTFLNQRRELGLPIDWRCDSVTASHLWRFHLHYHEFLLDVLYAAKNSSEANTKIDAAWKIVSDWIHRNRPTERSTRADAWHPFCISKRLPVWMLLWTARQPEERLAETVIASLFTQSRFLAANLERDLGGNHLLENLRTLILAGLFFEGPEANRWLDEGIRLFRREAKEQFLPHGEHFERAPMYHAIMLELVLDLRDALHEVRPRFATECADLANRMGDFLRAIVHPDGEIPLLSDSAFGECPPTPTLLSRLENGVSQSIPPRNTASNGDYWEFRSDEDYFLFDRGPLGVDHLPAHAHADLLGFEASLHGHRVFVDSGVYNYENDSMRAYCRGSAAHNVLTIDEADQCDLWSKFRMGYRGRVTESEEGTSGGFNWAFASHNAYRRRNVHRVDRLVACRNGGPWFIIDSTFGSGEHVFSSYIHLHPDIKPVPIAKDAVEFEVAGHSYVFCCAGAAGVEIEESWYCPRFGQKQANRAVVYRQSGTAPLAVAWCLFPKQLLGTVSWAAMDSLTYTDSRCVVEIDVPSRNITMKEKSLG